MELFLAGFDLSVNNLSKLMIIAPISWGPNKAVIAVAGKRFADRDFDE